MRIGITLLLLAMVVPSVARAEGPRADGMHVAVGAGVWGFVGGARTDVDGLSFEVAVAHRLGALTLGGRLFGGSEMKLNLLGNPPREKKGGLDIGPSIGVAVGSGAIALDAAATPALVKVTDTESVTTIGLGLDAGIAARVIRGTRHDGMLGLRLAADVNAERSFGGLLVTFLVSSH